jgi:hypothetical protein
MKLLITYAHSGDPDGVRYSQFLHDPVPVWAIDVRPDLESFPLLERHIMELHADSWAEDGRVPTMDSTLATIRASFDRLGPFCYAKAHNLLVNSSGEEFAIQFMSAYNISHPGTY